jgi:hypothetical protein
MITIHQDKHNRWYYTSEAGKRQRVDKPNLAPSVRKPAKAIKGPSRRTVDLHKRMSREQ